MIEIQNLQKVDESITILDIPELVIQDGEIAALVGPAGSGKQTLINILLGITRPSGGYIQLAGLDPNRDDMRLRNHIGVMFGDDAIYKSLSPKANLEFYCSLYGLPKMRADNVLSLIGLADHSFVKTSNLSSSLLRRLAFGRAIIHDPEILILHEPFIRCDNATIQILGTILRDMANDGKTILILSTDHTNLTPLCNSIYLMKNGQIVDQHFDEDGHHDMPFKIPVKFEEKVVLFNPADVLYADAAEGRAHLVTQSTRIPTQYNLTELENRLLRSGFFRAHRSYLVNLQHVKEVIPYTRNSYTLRLDDESGTEIPLSKTAASELRDLLGY